MREELQGGGHPAECAREQPPWEGPAPFPFYSQVS